MILPSEMLVRSNSAKQGCDWALEGPLPCFNKNGRRVHRPAFNQATVYFLLKLMLQIISLHRAVKAAKGDVHSRLYLWDSAGIKSAGIFGGC